MTGRVLAVLLMALFFARPAGLAQDKQSGEPDKQQESARLYNKAMDLAAAGQETAALKELRAAYHLYKNNNTLYQIARIQFRKKMTDSAIGNIHYLIAEAGTESNVKQQARILGQAIYDTLVNEAGRKLDDKYIDEAVAKYEKAAGFCKSTEGLICSQKGNNGLVKAKNSLYEDIIAKAKLELSNGNLENAEILADKALKYAHDNPEAIKKATMAEGALTSIFEKYYKRYLMKANEAYKAKHYNTSLKYLRQSEEYRQKKGLKTDPQYVQLLKATCKPLIAAFIDKARENKTNLALARDCYYSADSLALESGLKEGHLKDELDLLGSQVENRDCINLQANYKSIVLKASVYASENHFKEAIETYRAAIREKDSLPGCIIKTQDAEDKINQYLPAEQFQEFVKMADAAEKNSDYKNAISNFEAAEKIWHEDSLAKYNLQIKSTYEYIAGHDDAAFMIAGSSCLLNENRPEEAFRLLKMAIDKGYSSQTNDLQRKIAPQLAGADFKKQPDENPKKLVEQYCDGGPKFKVFRRVYLKKWKGLKK